MADKGQKTKAEHIFGIANKLIARLTLLESSTSDVALKTLYREFSLRLADGWKAPEYVIVFLETHVLPHWSTEQQKFSPEFVQHTKKQILDVIKCGVATEDILETMDKVNVEGSQGIIVYFEAMCAYYTA